ncbi:MAG: TonB-dependent receptor [Acidobacteria bacterium]|nr:TonB-dependent receptor [Acidobacteriota bacterium]
MRNLGALLVLALLLPAQVGTDGSILGIVQDPAGAGVAGAVVTVRNIETGLQRQLQASAEGAFEVLALPRGAYQVTVTAPGFATWNSPRVGLTVGEQRRLSPVLRLGDVKEQVTVEATAALIQTEKASVETAIDEKQIRDLPLNGRNPIEMVMLAPGMRWLGAAGLANEHTVQGGGKREDQTGFSVDGVDSNDPSNEKGFAFPNVDTVAQFSIQTANFSAENGRNPLQVQMVTKSGTNQFHGTLWEFHRNSAADARNAFALSRPKLIRNQFGYSLGGPVRRDRLFFFSSYEGTRIRQQRVYNSNTIAPSYLQGDFGARRVNDPVNNLQFPNNVIPASRFSSASRFFFPFVLQPNSPGNLFRALAPVTNDNNNFLVRGDYQISPTQRIYGRWVLVDLNNGTNGYRPDVVQTQNIRQNSYGLNYNWTVNATTLISVAAGLILSDTRVNSPNVGKDNLNEQAGLQGFPSAGREQAVGLPSVTFTGYTGFSLPQQVPARFRRQSMDLRPNVNHVVGRHTIGYGYEYNERRTLASHSSASPRGTFNFNGQYTGDGFGDYLLGLLANNERNYPLNSFGMAHSPYSALYLQDFFKVTPRITMNVGLRWDYWHEKGLVRNTGATFLPRIGKVVASVDKNGQVDLSSQAVSPFLAPATRSLWVPASEAGIPRGLFEATGYVSPRMGVAWRLKGDESLVLRAGMGSFTGNFNGNITGSQVIGPPYWTFERVTFARTTLQRWETSFPANPQAFIAPSVTGVAYDVRPMKVHEWNVSLQTLIPGTGSALTLSYVGNRGRELITRTDYNEVAPGRYTNLQAARPYPAMGTVRLYENIGRSWYNALQVKAERRFQKGFGYILAYAFARNIDDAGDSLADTRLPFAPAGYHRGRSDLERRHVLTLNGIWEVPLARRKLYGGWQVTGIYNFTSGPPLSFTTPGATLGNGFNTRANLTGAPGVEQPSADRWFNAAAFAAPPQFAWGSSGIGLIDGPGQHNLNLALMKDFPFGEARYVQFRWELFNAPNHVNLGQPLTTLGQPLTARITSADAARQMQFGLKVIF